MKKAEQSKIFLEVSELEEKAMLVIKMGKTPDIAIWLSLEQIQSLKALLNNFHYKLKKYK